MDNVQNCDSYIVILRFLLGVLYVVWSNKKIALPLGLKEHVNNVLISVPLEQRLKRFYNKSVFLHLCNAV
jgi:hypothetical protein